MFLFLAEHELLSTDGIVFVTLSDSISETLSRSKLEEASYPAWITLYDYQLFNT